MTQQEQIQLQYEEAIRSGKWKPVLIDGHKTVYVVSSDGRVVNKETSLLMAGTVSCGKTKIAMRYKVGNETVKKKCSLDRLVAEAFLPEHDPTDEISHIDGDRLNCDVGNLRWLSTKVSREGRRHFGQKLNVDGIEYETEPLPVQTLTAIFRDMMYTDIQDNQYAIHYKIHPRLVHRLRGIVQYLTQEGLILDDGTVDMQWTSFDVDGNTNHRYEVSPYGLIRTKDDDNIFAGIVGGGGYIKVSLSYLDGTVSKATSWTIGKVVGRRFISQIPGKPVIVHLDGDLDHDWVSNLQWMSYKEARAYLVSLGKWKELVGTDNGKSRFTPDQVRRACEMMCQHIPPMVIEQETGLNNSDLYRLRHGGWPNITKEFDLPSGVYTSAGKFIADDGTVINNDDPRRSPTEIISKYTREQVQKAIDMIASDDYRDGQIRSETGISISEIRALRKLLFDM